MTKTLLLLPGDGIGPEVTAEVRRVAEWMAAHAGLDLTIDELPYGGTAYDQFGTPLPEETRLAALASDAALMGAVGGPQWADAPRHLRPEAALLTLRKDMDVFANLRPALCFDALADASTLKREVVAGLDIMIVRELTSGVYFGQPRGVETLPDGTRRCIDTQSYTVDEIERVARVAFELARGRRNKVVSAEKANVMETGLFWREVVTALHKRDYADVELEHMLADNAAMQLVKNPKQFDVIVTDNLFGDILSDEASMLTGGIGLLPSAALGAPGKPGLYEPIHGSAPDIAGKGVANPIAAILSFEMALRWSLGREDLADRLFAAVKAALDGGAKTRDIGGALSTREMGGAVIAELQTG
jgi:3-isopropylmalate dehydrogenase